MVNSYVRIMDTSVHGPFLFRFRTYPFFFCPWTLRQGSVCDTAKFTTKITNIGQLILSLSYQVDIYFSAIFLVLYTKLTSLINRLFFVQATGYEIIRFSNKQGFCSEDYQTVACKKKEKVEIFPFFEWESLFLYVLLTTRQLENQEP